jgi:hypothetical protein
MLHVSACTHAILMRVNTFTATVTPELPTNKHRFTITL